MKRREFLGIVGVGAFHKFAVPKFDTEHWNGPSRIASDARATESKPYGSGHFGEWITDQFGLPAYRYTCNQITDPKAVTPVHKQWRGPTDHTHQVWATIASLRQFRTSDMCRFARTNFSEISERLFSGTIPLRGWYRFPH